MEGLAKGVGDEGEREGLLPSHASPPPPPLPPPSLLRPPRRPEKRLRWLSQGHVTTVVRNCWFFGQKCFFNIIIYRGGYMLVTCYFLLAKKLGTVPQMIPNLGVGRRERDRPLFFEILYYCYRIMRKIKSISIDDKWASLPATPFWIFWIRPWISTKNDPVKSLDSERCWVLEQRVYRVDVFLKDLFVKQNLCSLIRLLAKSIYWRNWRT